jgi:hypothetical protein
MPPVLLVAFNRPDETARVIERLRSVKAEVIYFAVDGARKERPEETQLVHQTQELVKEFDWDCKLLTQFQNKNLGCGLGVSTAISWALTNEESVIVLEDDVLPDPSFFLFCQELLERFSEDDKVFAISGSNFVPKRYLSTRDSYRFTPITHVWGWAVWKRSWEKYEFDITNWRSGLTFTQLKHQLGGSWLAAILWSRLFDLVAQHKIDTWDYQLAFASLKSKSLIATSNVNLTENLGFGERATHTARAPKHIKPTLDIDFPLSHPSVVLDEIANRWTQRHVHGAGVGSGLNLLVKYAKLSLQKSAHAALIPIRSGKDSV